MNDQTGEYFGNERSPLYQRLTLSPLQIPLLFPTNTSTMSAAYFRSTPAETSNNILSTLYVDSEVGFIEKEIGWSGNSVPVDLYRFWYFKDACSFGLKGEI